MTTTYYKAIVKDNVDKTGAGRIRVYIPSLGGNPDAEQSWYVVNYMSSYMGSTNPQLNAKGGKKEAESQDAYGSFMNGYHLENEVVVSFPDGDFSQGVVVGSMFGQNMTNSIAGYPSAKSTNGKLGGVHPPTVEYNKRDEDINARAPEIPRREKLTEQLWKQGLFRDFTRGQIDTSPRRDPVPQFQSFKNPSGSVFTIDDGKISADTGAGVDARRYDTGQASKPYVRMRGANGAQFLMNSNCGFVYMNSKDGNSWAQIGNHGIQFFTAGHMISRTQGNFSQRSDANYNVEVGGDKAVLVHGDMHIESDGSYSVKAGGNMTEQTNGIHSTKSGGAQIYESAGTHKEKAGSNIIENSPSSRENASAALSGYDVSDAATSQSIDRASTSSPKLSDNADPSASGPTSKQANETTVPEGQMVTHEPYAYQPYACGGPDSYAEEGSPSGEATEQQPLADGSTDDVPTEPNAVPANGGEMNHPLDGEGRLSPNFGQDRGTHKHGGVDIAAPAGTPIKAVAPGTVTKSYNSSSYGNVVYIDHGNGVETRYAHMVSPSQLKVGDRVSTGTYIGGVGNTGRSSGNHLHFEVRKNGAAVNPLPYINGSKSY